MSAARAEARAGAPALSLYVHFPWCLRKCPYCDFNSHGLKDEPPFDAYASQLLRDLDLELRDPAAQRPLVSIFIGGGTPSLVPPWAIRRLIEGVSARTALAGDCEITLEANPGATDSGHLAAYHAAGVNRLSIGVQSLSAEMLRRLGRIHDPAAARAALESARAAGFDNINLDLMFALPGQGLAEARADLDALIALGPEHISYYQLTLEPNTAFHSAPPPLPDADLAADIAAQGQELLAVAGYTRYEVSAYARPGRRCRHNLNYWRFGDYLGIGAGAHGKLTDPADGRVRRRVKPKHPDAYLANDPTALAGAVRQIAPDDLIFEFALNAFRLTGGFELGLFERATGLPWFQIANRMEQAQADRLIVMRGDRIEPTPLGLAFVDNLVSMFLPPDQVNADQMPS